MCHLGCLYVLNYHSYYYLELCIKRETYFPSLKKDHCERKWMVTLVSLSNNIEHIFYSMKNKTNVDQARAQL